MGSWHRKELGMLSLKVAFRCPFINTQKTAGYLFCWKDPKLYKFFLLLGPLTC